MKYVTTIQTIIIFLLFATLALRESSFDKEALDAAKYIKHVDSVYYTHKDSV